MNLIDELNREHIAEIAADKNVPDFQAGDTLKVNVKVKEGTRERIQAYEGVYCPLRQWPQFQLYRT